MTFDFWIIVLIMIILAIISLRTGYILGRDNTRRKITNEIVQEYKAKYEKHLIEEFERRVNEAVEQELAKARAFVKDILQKEGIEYEDTDSD